MKKRVGSLVPLFSLYSHNSIGIADFADLRLLIDWLRDTGQSILQLLPMNEMTGIFCPYDASSSFALEPAYFSLSLLNAAKVKNIKAKLNDIKRAFPAGRPFVDYRIKQAKLSLLKEVFAQDTVGNNRQLEYFYQENRYWLEGFALYKALKEYHHGRPWYEWEERYKQRDQATLEEFKETHREEIAFTVWVQWQLWRQFRETKEYCAQKKVLLKGDLPILVSRDSADVWEHPEFFKLEFASGAPPDMYCAKGQRWGMPPYHWANIAADGFSYLKERLKYAENFYDALRIDHVVGLFRIWNIPYAEPAENQGLNGFFEPREESQWKEHGRNILKVLLENTKMLLSAEDLGVIPKACTEVLAELGIPGNDVQRWVKDWKTRHDFLESQEYRALSVAMLSTHDTTNWLAWWENEAGTIDEALFLRKCAGRVDAERARKKLFDPEFSRHGRLRWLNSVDSIEKLLKGLLPKGTVPKEHLVDFIDLYENSFQEKEKLWKKLGLEGVMRERGDAEILEAAIKFTLRSAAVFVIHSMTDWLGLAGVFKGDPYQYRVNTPGTISEKNWSQVLPLALEDLLQHPINSKIRQLVVDAERN
jgi:4-alpha-glucanotransferase